MTKENWIQLIIPSASIVTAIITVAFTYYFSKRRQILYDERRLKEKFYIEYINALSNNVISHNLEESAALLSEAQNNILLIGSSDVVSKLQKYSEYIGFPKGKEFNLSEHNWLLTELIKSMRIDLYKNKKVNYRYPTIWVSGRLKK